MSTTPDPQLLHKGRGGFETGAAILREHLLHIPDQPGVYRMIATGGTVLYVGKAKNLKKRVSSYTQRARLPHRLQRMVAQIRQVEIVTTRTEAEALLLEANFIQKLAPPFNVLLRDDKSYPYILITRPSAPKSQEDQVSDPTKPLPKVDAHDFPQLAKHRGAQNRKGWYFGPFASSSSVTETLTLLQRAFQLRNCSDGFFSTRSRPCLQYHIKRCTAPCVGKVSIADYARQAEEARDFLKGKNLAVQEKLATDMQQASERMDFENAAILRDRIKVLTSMQARQDINVAGIGDADIVGLHQQGGKTAVQVFFFRGDRNYGARVYYPTHDPHVPAEEILSSLLAQFYAGKTAPNCILLSHRPDDVQLLQTALTETANHKVSMTVPQAGVRKRLVDHAVKNAEEALGRHLSGKMEQAKLLDRVAEIFNLPEAPKRIEVYDNSHISGAHAVGGMIAAGPEGFLKKTYRKFNIRGAIAAGDDYAMMEEVLTRRFRRLAEEDPERKTGMWPDLVLIDGGAGQLGKALEVLGTLGIQDVPMVGIAKGPDRNAGRERFFIEGRDTFSLPMEDPALYYLQRLRDEAHRYAIGTHRAKRTKAIGQSGLEDIPGIGATRKRALLHHFGSAKAVAGAGLEELARTPGISAAVAQKIHDFYRS